METSYKQGIKVYQSTNGRFTLWERPNIRDYILPIIRQDDHIYIIEVDGYHAFETVDLGQMLYYLIKNKQKIRAREHELEKLIPFIHKAFKASPECQVPLSTIPVCEYTNCLPCPLYQSEHCHSAGAFVQRAFTGEQL